jgi:hypothetical protein
MRAPNLTPTEHQEQVLFVQWFRLTYPGVLINATPNAAKRSMRTAGMMKAEGMVAGIPDLFIPAWNVWIEMKRRQGGKLSPEQKRIIKYLKANGATVHVCKGADEATQVVIDFYAKHEPHLLKHTPLEYP